MVGVFVKRRWFGAPSDTEGLQIARIALLKTRRIILHGQHFC
jgi:hypothetical protein